MSAHHVCFVSDQPVPSLTPLLDPALGVRQVTLVHAPERARHAGWLAQALALHGIEAEPFALRDGFDLEWLRADMERLANRHPEGVVANITGGSKPMTIAAWETFRRPADRLYYIDIRRDSLRWLRPAAPEVPIADRIRLETYVTAHGFQIHPKRPPRRTLPARVALEAARQRVAKLVQKQRKEASEGGEWLEELVFAEVKALLQHDPRLQDVARQFVIDDGADDPAARVTNEIDVAILRDNTLYLVECKTGMAGRSKGAADAIYKLAQLVAQLGGLRGRGIFVTSELLSPPIKARAQALSIAIIDRSALGQLAVALKTALVQGAPLTSPAQPSGQSRDDLHGDLRPATR